MSHQRILAANWKMNLGPHAARQFALQIKESCSSSSTTSVWIAPPLVSLSATSEVLTGSSIGLGAQNIHWVANGAFTGETSPEFLKELGVSWSLVGHSERRHIFGESSELVARRVVGAIEFGIIPVLCVGETEKERQAGDTEKVLLSQLDPVFSVLSPESWKTVVIAYEPVWAIGTGKVATTEEIDAAHSFVKSTCLARGCTTAPRVLYGGSVNPSNYGEIVSLASVDGALVGGASLKLDQWGELLRISNSAKEG